MTETSGSRTPARPLTLAGTAPLIAFLVSATVVVVPILMHTYLPLADLPNHIARHYVIANMNATLSQYYDHAWAFIPNSAADFLWYLLGYPGDPVRFSQLIMAAYAVLLIGASMILARVVHGHWTVWSAVAALIVYNLPFYWGFQNFLLSVPFAILGLALWLTMERGSNTMRAAVFVPLALGLYFMHLVAFAALGAAAFGRECHRLLAALPQDRRRLGQQMAISAVPFLIPTFLVIAGVLFGATSEIEPRTEYGGVFDRWLAVISPFHFWNRPVLISLAIPLFLTAAFLSIFRRSGMRLVFNPIMLGPVIALLALSVVTPNWLNGVLFMQIRFPLVLMVLMFAATVPQIDRARSHLLSIALLALLMTQSVALERIFARFDSEVRDLRATLEKLPEGARVGPVRYRLGQAGAFRLHIEAYAVLWRDALVPTLFQETHTFKYQPEWRALVKTRDFVAELDPELAPNGTPGNMFYLTTKVTEDLSGQQVIRGHPQEREVLGELKKVAQHGHYGLYELIPVD